MDTVQPPKRAFAQPGMFGAVLAAVPHRDVPGGVHHDAVLDDVRVRTAVLLDVVRVELDDAQAAVAGVGRIAVGMGEGVGDVQGQAVLVAPQQLDLGGVELAGARVLVWSV